ncbi:MAG: hypothetical protein AAB604_01360 [Patescibacteria group bacterium]
MPRGLEKEITFFDQIKQVLIDNGHDGEYVAISSHRILGYGANPHEIIKNLSSEFKKTPDPLLIRKIQTERILIKMRSPRVPKT